MKSTGKRTHHEQEIHRAVWQHLRTRSAPGTFAWHTPNGGKRCRTEAAIFAGLGVVAGIPDIMLVRGGQLYALELKTYGRCLSNPQMHCQENLKRCGAIVATAIGADHAIWQLEQWGLLRGKADLNRFDLPDGLMAVPNDPCPACGVISP